VEIDIATEQVAAGVAVQVRVRLDRREVNRLFLNGDSLIQLPVDGALPDSEGAPIPRMSIFLSELAGSARGLTRVFSDLAAASAYEDAVRRQLHTALEGS
jgi:hypothetical protein